MKRLSAAGVVLIVLVLLVYGYQPRPLPPRSGSGLENEHYLAIDTPSRLRVGVYNIYKGRGTDGVENLRRTADVVQTVDILSLYEVAGPVPLWRDDQALQMSELEKMAYLFVPGKRRLGIAGSGSALLSRLPAPVWRDIPLPPEESSFRRLLTAELEWKGRRFHVFSTHLDLRADRDIQLRKTLDEFSRHSPAILLGDLNSRRDSPALQVLLSETSTVDALAVALGEERVAMEVDWILTRGFRVLEGGRVPAGVSDHPYLWVALDFAH